MRGRALHHALGVRPSKPLVVRGGIVRTFGGLASFLAVTFLCSGIYLLEDAFANPIAAQAAALITGAFIIALATILLYFLLRPRAKSGLANSQRPRHDARSASELSSKEAPTTTHEDDANKDSMYQRFYVDHSRIRP
jgi:hypothetical protein